MNLIAEGNTLDQLAACDSMLSRGDKVEVRIYLTHDLTVEQISQVEQGVCDGLVRLSGPIYQAARMLVVKFEKEMFPLEDIACLSVVSQSVSGVVSAAEVVGWQLSKESVFELPMWAWVAVMAGLTAGGIFVGRKYGASSR